MLPFGERAEENGFGVDPPFEFDGDGQLRHVPRLEGGPWF
jgi:hypothetical protein